MLYRQLNIISNRDLWRSAANTEVILLSAVISQLLFLPLTTKSSTLMSTDKHDLSHQDRLEFVFEFLLKRFRIVLHFKLVTSKFDFDTHTHTHVSHLCVLCYYVSSPAACGNKAHLKLPPAAKKPQLVFFSLMLSLVMNYSRGLLCGRRPAEGAHLLV